MFYVLTVYKNLNIYSVRKKQDSIILWLGKDYITPLSLPGMAKAIHCDVYMLNVFFNKQGGKAIHCEYSVW